MLSEVRLATMQLGEGLKGEGMHHINLCSLEGQLYGRSESSEKVTDVSENSPDFFYYLLALLALSLPLNGNSPELVLLYIQQKRRG